MLNTTITLIFCFDILGGIITESDLANYTAKVKSPLHFRLHDGSDVYSPPPPSSGAVYLFILNVLNGKLLDMELCYNLDSILA